MRHADIEEAHEDDGFDITRSRPFGHVAEVFAVLRGLDHEKQIVGKRSRPRDLEVAMIVARIVAQRSKLATARGLSGDSLRRGLGKALSLSEPDTRGTGYGNARTSGSQGGETRRRPLLPAPLGEVDEDELYEAMDWLLER